MKKQITIEVTADNAEEIIDNMMQSVCEVMTDTIMYYDNNEGRSIKITSVLDDEVQVSDNSVYLEDHSHG